MNLQTLNVMLIDDDPVDVEIFSRYAEEVPLCKVNVTAFTDPMQAVSSLERGGGFDLVFIDYMLGARNGIEVIQALRDRGVMTPVVMLTGQGSEAVAVNAMKAGAADYLVKSELSGEDIGRTLKHVIEKENLRRTIEEQQRELERLARMDDLTGIYNRRWFMHLLVDAVADSAGRGRPVSLMMIDVDHFKAVNDTYGHISGDEALKLFARTAVAALAGRGFAGRFGGEEFCVFLPGIAFNEARRVAEEVRAAIETTSFRDETGARFPLTCSIGVAEYNGDGNTLRDVIHDADEALYRAKAGGRNRVCP